MLQGLSTIEQGLTPHKTDPRAEIFEALPGVTKERLIPGEMTALITRVSLRSLVN
jgi:hypothetical protein